MSDYMEFKGKTLDLAIKEACAYFGVNREKLEIDIINDAKLGIFGLVGAKKATIKARRTRLGASDDLSPSETKDYQGEGEKRGSKHVSERGKPRQERESANKQHQSGLGKTDADTEALENRGLVVDDSSLMCDAEKRTQANDDALPRSGSLKCRGGVQRDKARATSPARGVSSAKVASSDDEAVGACEVESRFKPSSNEDTSFEPSRERRQDHKEQRRSSDRSVEKSTDGRGRGRGRLARDDEDAPARTESERPSRGRGGAAGVGREQRAEKSALAPVLSQDATADDGVLFDDEASSEGFAPLNVESVGADKIIAETSAVILRLVESIVDAPTCQVEITPDSKIRVTIDAGESSGLLIGRYSQTLTAIQYIASRILSRIFGASARLQVDAGDYRERQDDKMRELALSLAQKVKEEGRTLYTRPLSSYQRRVVHVTLQDDPELQTRSKGEGVMKRVLIALKRK